MGSFIVFALCILGIYTGTNIYMAFRLSSWLELSERALFIIPFMIFAMLFVAAELMRDRLSVSAERILDRAGGYYLGAYTVMLLLTVLADLFGKGEPVTALLIMAAGAAVCIFAAYQADRVDIKNYKIKSPDGPNMKIAFVSDIHIGRIIGEKHINKIVCAVNSTDPDFVFIGGDILDTGPCRFVDEEGAKRAFSKLKSRNGVYACLGNHDGGFCGKEQEAKRLIESWGIKVLYDEAVRVGNINIAGRKDRDDPSGRMTARELLGSLEGYTVLLDHRPGNLEEEAAAGADLVLCGHTHKGQIFPFNLVTAAVYKPNYGMVQKDSCHMIVSSGAGTWGPKMRLGSKCEAVEIEITGE